MFMVVKGIVWKVIRKFNHFRCKLFCVHTWYNNDIQKTIELNC